MRPRGGGIFRCMLASGVGIHWAAIASVGLVLGGLVVGSIWRLGTVVAHWREENAQAQGELAGLVADWCDEVDDHLGDQDDALRQFGHRVERLEQRLGIESGALYLHPRRRRRPRRMDAAERGLRASEGHLAPDYGAERGRRIEGGSQPPW